MVVAAAAPAASCMKLRVAGGGVWMCGESEMSGHLNICSGISTELGPGAPIARHRHRSRAQHDLTPPGAILILAHSSFDPALDTCINTVDS